MARAHYSNTRVTLGFWVCLDRSRSSLFAEVTNPGGFFCADDGFGNLRPCPCPVYAIECESDAIRAESA